MKLKKINLKNLRNDEHFQYHTQFCNLVKKSGIESLKIQAQFETYLVILKQEDEAFKKVVKSAITAEIQDADKRRNKLFRGMVVSNVAALAYFDEKVQAPAKRLQILFDTYGNLSRKPLNAKTSALYNLLQELNETYAQDAKLVGLSAWVKELHKSNDVFDELMTNRYEERASKTDLVLKEVRVRLDDAYRMIVERIDALTVIEGMQGYSDFIRNLNVIIETYTVMLAQRTGKKMQSDNATVEISN